MPHGRLLSRPPPSSSRCGGAWRPSSSRPLHAFELQAVGVQEEHGVIVVVVLAGRIDDFGAQLLHEILQRVDVLAAAQFEPDVVQADVAEAILVLLALRVRGARAIRRLRQPRRRNSLEHARSGRQASVRLDAWRHVVDSGAPIIAIVPDNNWARGGPVITLMKGLSDFPGGRWHPRDRRS